MITSLSILLNVALLLALSVVSWRAKGRIREEKVATFAGVLAAISESLIMQPKEAELETLAEALSKLRGNPMMEPSELKWRLARATVLRSHRHPIAADALGEPGHAFMVGWVKPTPELEALGDAANEDIVDPRAFNEQHGDAKLARAQYIVEADIVRAYAATLDGESVKIFQPRWTAPLRVLEA